MKSTAAARYGLWCLGLAHLVLGETEEASVCRVSAGVRLPVLRGKVLPVGDEHCLFALGRVAFHGGLGDRGNKGYVVFLFFVAWREASIVAGACCMAAVVSLCCFLQRAAFYSEVVVWGRNFGSVGTADWSWL